MSAVHEETRALDSRTDLYELRADLVRLLQVKARGVSRGERARLHREFVDGWQHLRERRELFRVQEIVRRGSRGRVAVDAPDEASWRVVAGLARTLAGGLARGSERPVAEGQGHKPSPARVTRSAGSISQCA